MTTATPSTRPYDTLDLSSRAFWAQDAAGREQTFAELRRDRPVSWHRPVDDALLTVPDDPGFWAVTRHADVVTVSRNNDVFVSGQGVLFESIPQELLEASQSFLAMDPPRHHKIRKLVSAAFTPRQVRRIDDQIKQNAEDIVRELAEAGPGVDFVEHCAKQLPVRTISDMAGIPASERDNVARAADALVSWADPVFLNGRNPLETLGEGQTYLHRIAGELIADRRKNPGDDLLTSLVQAEVDGERLSDFEIGAFFVLLAVAGNDTTRQTTSHAMKALTDHPDQRAYLTEDFDNRIGVAVEEFVRWASPVMTFRRTAVAEYELGGRRILPGEKVVMFYSSANWDAEVFDRPDVFDVSRDPNPHLGFGGGGVHFCLGAHVARAQLRAVFGELLRQLPTLEVSDPALVPGNFVHAIRTMPCSF